MAADLKIRGAAQLNAALLELSAEVAGRLGQNAVRAGARVVAAEAKRRVPVESGALKRSIKVFTESKREAGKRTAYAGTRLFYGKFSEFGTAHEPARPWLRPALDEGGQQAVDKIAANLRAGINRVAVKHGGKADGPTSAGSDLDLFALGFELGAGE
jgi:HK97 gp10 family phage protein